MTPRQLNLPLNIPPSRRKNTLLERLQQVHEQCIRELSPAFGIQPPRPLEIRLFDNKRAYAEGYLSRCSFERKSKWLIRVSYSSLMQMDITCAHETGHYLDLLKEGEEYFGHCELYYHREFKAINACFLFFELLGKFPEMKSSIETEDPLDQTKEKAVLKMMNLHKQHFYNTIPKRFYYLNPVVNEFKELAQG